MKVSDILADESKWCQRTAARDSNGQACAPNSPTAVSWCLFGATAKVSGGRTSELYYRVFSALCQTCDQLYQTSYIVDWQDDPRRTWAEISHLIQKAGV